MRRKDGVLGLVALVAAGCVDKQVGDGTTNPFGDGTTMTSAPVTSDGSADSGMAETTGSATGQPTTAATTAAGASSSTGGDDTSTSSTGTPGDSSGAPGDGQLGGCIGTGAWQNCAQYCQANLDVCVPGGCEGLTVVYYDDVAACRAMESDGGEAIACDEGFAMGGGISFARCCCA